MSQVGDRLPPGICPLCGANVEDVQRTGHWHGESGGGFWYSGRCVACDVDFWLDTGTKPIAWQIAAPDAASLQTIVTDAELAKISGKLARYKIHSEKWRLFLARRRPGDELWSYRRENWDNGIAVVRRGTPIARFMLHSG